MNGCWFIGIISTTWIGPSTESTSKGSSPNNLAKLLCFHLPVLPLIVLSSQTHKNNVSTTTSNNDKTMWAMKNANNVTNITGATLTSEPFKASRVNNPQSKATNNLPKKRMKSPIVFTTATWTALVAIAFQAMPAAGQKLIDSIAITV